MPEENAIIIIKEKLGKLIEYCQTARGDDVYRLGYLMPSLEAAANDFSAKNLRDLWTRANGVLEAQAPLITRKDKQYIRFFALPISGARPYDPIREVYTNAKGICEEALAAMRKPEKNKDSNAAPSL